MKVKELIDKLTQCNPDAEVLAEEKITGDEMSFDYIMGCYTHKETIVFYQR